RTLWSGHSNRARAAEEQFRVIWWNPASPLERAMPVQILTIESQPFAENSYVVWEDSGTDCFVIDPGFEPELIREALNDRGLTLVAIVCTHGHCDHIAGNTALKQAYPHA